VNVSALRKFVCPVDGKPLLQEKNSLRCEKNHVFDLAREGYCNLLLVQQKASLDPGDNKEMVAARRRFLDGGYFAPIADHLFEMVVDIARAREQEQSLGVVDAGCGEGYFLNQLKELAEKSAHSASLELAGCDISKWAVKAAAKRSDKIAWAVAGNRQLPFAPNSVDLILSMFGYPSWENFRACQPAGGCVLLVDPGGNHLLELRKIIYPEVKPSPTPQIKEAIDCGYVLERESSLKFPLNLQSLSSIQDLLSMTPHGFRITQKGRDGLVRLEQLMVSVELVFRILWLEK
jgi:23S rRNA (guanine745-N1)-methyltransferase